MLVVPTNPGDAPLKKLTEMLETADFSHLASIFILLQKMKSSSVGAPCSLLDSGRLCLTLSEELLRIVLQISSVISDRFRDTVPR